MFGPGIQSVCAWQLQQSPVWEAHYTVKMNVKKEKIKTYEHVYTSFMQHEKCLVTFVNTVSVAHSGKQGWLHKNLNSTDIFNHVRLN